MFSSSGGGAGSLDRRRPTSPHRSTPRGLSVEESDALIEAVITQRTSLLSDPEVQMVLRKSYSLDDLLEPDALVSYRYIL